MTPTISKQTIASEQKRLNGQTFSLNMIRSPKPPASPSKSRTGTRFRTTGVISGPQEIRLQQLQHLAYSLQSTEDPLMKAILETMEAKGLERAEMLGRTEYEAVERRLELFIQRSGGKVPNHER